MESTSEESEEEEESDEDGSTPDEQYLKGTIDYNEYRDAKAQQRVDGLYYWTEQVTGVDYTDPANTPKKTRLPSIGFIQ